MANKITGTNRRKMLEQLIPEGVAFTRLWLMNQTKLNSHAIDNLVKSGQINLLQKGIYVRGSARLSWQSIIYTLQSIMNLDLMIGGLTALELYGYSHYLTVSNKHLIRVYGNDKLPDWVNDVSDNISFFRTSRNGLFENMDPLEYKTFVQTIPWKEGMSELKISCPEKAYLEVLNDVPRSISMEHADQLMQGMTALSPRILQSLLEECSSIKVKRLFLWFGSRHNYNWFSKLKIENIHLGSGNRVIVKGGILDKTYKITVPRDL